VRGLGCHAADNFGRCMAQRTDQDYKKDLENLIEVNRRTRRDEIGEMENLEAQKVFKRLDL
jgi:hypothetical protein